MASRMIQNNFSGGEISPSLFGRSDLQAYYKGAADIENFVVSKEGTLRKRHGISSFMTLPADYARCKVIPYKYDRTEGGFFVLYTTEAAPTVLVISLYAKDGTFRMSSKVSGFSGSVRAFQYKQIGDEVWISNESVFRTLTVTTTSETDPMSTATFTVDEWSQAARPPAVTNWTATPSVSGKSERYIYYAVYGVKDSVISKISTKSVGWTKTWTAGTYITIAITVNKTTAANYWDYIIVAKRNGGAYGELTRFYTDDTESDWEFVDENHTAGDAIYGQTNVLGDGFTTPLCVDCFQQRRVFANSTNDAGTFPMTLWFSETGNLDNFYADRPTADDDPFSPTIAASGPAFILWTVCYQEMMVLFTESGLFSVGFSQQQGFSASSCRISKFSDLAASPSIQPVVTEAGIVFVGADNKTVYSVSYDLQENMLKPINRTVLVEHLTRTAQITGIGLQDYPDNVIWVSTSDGKACSFTIEKNENVFSWSHSRITDADILGVVGTGTCTDSDTDRTYGDLLFVVEKDGVQYLAKQNTGYTDVIGDTETNVCASMTTLRPESQERTIVGYRKNIKDVLIRVYQTGGLAVRSPDGNDMPLVEARVADNPYTGDVKVMPRGVINEDGQLVIVSDNDAACELLQIVMTMEVE